MAKKGTIVLSLTTEGWFADYSGSASRAEIHNLFGTTLILTGFTARAKWQTVKRDIERLNPEITVEVR